MRKIIAVFQKEWMERRASIGMLLMIAAFPALTALLLFVFAGYFSMNTASFKPLFDTVLSLIPLFVSALCMDLWPSERRKETAELLFSLPITIKELVVGKWVYTWLVATVYIATCLPIALALLPLGDFDVGVLATAFIGSLLFAGVACAVGQWASIVARRPLPAFLFSAAILALFVWGNALLRLLQLPHWLELLLHLLSLSAHMDAFMRGIIDLRDLTYFLLAGAFFLYLAAHRLASFRKGVSV